jgi:hypothetical protein
MMVEDVIVASRRRFNKSEFFRWCRIIHGWLSAFAFLMLLFFSVTGILLNHPEWGNGSKIKPVEKQFTLSAEQIDLVRSAQVPAEALAVISAKEIAVVGAYRDGDLVGSELFARLQGVRGLTDIRANLRTGLVIAIIEPAPTGKLLNELHRAEHAGKVWRLVVDAIAVVLILMSMIGYLIFLSLRFRLRTALILTAASAIGVWGVFALAIP